MRCKRENRLCEKEINGNITKTEREKWDMIYWKKEGRKEKRREKIYEIENTSMKRRKEIRNIGRERMDE
jgi:hypothetical protein